MLKTPLNIKPSFSRRKFGFESYGVMLRAIRVRGADFDALMLVKRFRQQEVRWQRERS
jgi:hypothetical protein